MLSKNTKKKKVIHNDIYWIFIKLLLIENGSFKNSFEAMKYVCISKNNILKITPLVNLKL